MAVILKEHHRQLIIESLQLICDYKAKALRAKSWEIFEKQYLTSAVEQISNNEFKVNNPKSNYFLWHLDNLCWSRKIIEGVKLKEGIPLIDTNLGAKVEEVCRIASKGQTFYNQYYTTTEFANLFDLEQDQ